MIQYFPIVTGSLTVLGNINVSGSITTSGSITISGSITSASFASTASFVANAESASNAVSAATASFANAFTVAGNLTAQTLVVQTITSSVVYSSGSNVFGNNIANTQVLTGSVNITGSLAVITNGTEFQVTSTGVNFGNIIGDTHNITGSLRVSGSTTTFTNTETTFNFNPQTSLLSGYNYLNFGGGSIMYRNATDLYFGSNAKYGSAGTVVANYTSANGMGLLTMDGGALRWQANNTSVTAGTAYGVPIRFAINGDGNVGIGTAGPVSTNLTGSLTIIKSYSGDTPTSTTAQNYYNNQSNLYLFGRNAGLTMVGNTNEECIIAFASPSSDYLGAIRYETQSTSAGGAMKFQTGGANERMRITAGGEVVIGTTTSFNNEKLRVAGTISSGVPAMSITSAVDTLNVSSGTTTTVWTCPDYPRVMYFMVFTRVNSGANVDYSAYAVVASSNIAGAKFLTNVGSAYLNLSISGRDIRVTQTSGATIGIHTSVIQIFSNAGTI
jgi:hypothetical protein